MGVKNSRACSRHYYSSLIAYWSPQILDCFNQTTYWAGTKYQSGQTIEVPEAKAAEWDKLSCGNIYKPRGSKKEK